MEIFIKKGQTRIDDPRRHPDYEKARKKGEQLWKAGKMKFENEAQKRDYLKRVASNEGNVLGIPAFFPPTQIKSFIYTPLKSEDTMDNQISHKPCGHPWVAANYKDNYIVYRCEHGHEWYRMYDEFDEVQQEEDIFTLHKKIKEKFAKENIKQLYLLCEGCDGSENTLVTLHAVSAEDCYCLTCGKHKKYRLV